MKIDFSGTRSSASSSSSCGRVLPPREVVFVGEEYGTSINNDNNDNNDNNNNHNNHNNTINEGSNPDNVIRNSLEDSSRIERANQMEVTPSTTSLNIGMEEENLSQREENEIVDGGGPKTLRPESDRSVQSLLSSSSSVKMNSQKPQQSRGVASTTRINNTQRTRRNERSPKGSSVGATIKRQSQTPKQYQQNLINQDNQQNRNRSSNPSQPIHPADQRHDGDNISNTSQQQHQPTSSSTNTFSEWLTELAVDASLFALKLASEVTVKTGTAIVTAPPIQVVLPPLLQALREYIMESTPQRLQDWFQLVYSSVYYFVHTIADTQAGHEFVERLLLLGVDLLEIVSSSKFQQYCIDFMVSWVRLWEWMSTNEFHELMHQLSTTCIRGIDVISFTKLFWMDATAVILSIVTLLSSAETTTALAEITAQLCYALEMEQLELKKRKQHERVKKRSSFRFKKKKSSVFGLRQHRRYERDRYQQRIYRDTVNLLNDPNATIEDAIANSLQLPPVKPEISTTYSETQLLEPQQLNSRKIKNGMCTMLHKNLTMPRTDTEPIRIAGISNYQQNSSTNSIAEGDVEEPSHGNEDDEDSTSKDHSVLYDGDGKAKYAIKKCDDEVISTFDNGVDVEDLVVSTTSNAMKTTIDRTKKKPVTQLREKYITKATAANNSMMTPKIATQDRFKNKAILGNMENDDYTDYETSTGFIDYEDENSIDHNFDVENCSESRNDSIQVKKQDEKTMSNDNDSKINKANGEKVERFHNILDAVLSKKRISTVELELRKLPSQNFNVSNTSKMCSTNKNVMPFVHRIINTRNTTNAKEMDQQQQQQQQPSSGGPTIQERLDTIRAELRRNLIEQQRRQHQHGSFNIGIDSTKNAAMLTNKTSNINHWKHLMGMAILVGMVIMFVITWTGLGFYGMYLLLYASSSSMDKTNPNEIVIRIVQQQEQSEDLKTLTLKKPDDERFGSTVKRTNSYPFTTIKFHPNIDYDQIAQCVAQAMQ